MEQLSEKEVQILKYIRTQRHKTTIKEIARDLEFLESEVEVFVSAMLNRDLIKVIKGATPAEDGYYTNPEKREKIFELIG